MGETTTPNEQPDRWMNYREAAEFSSLGRTTLWTLASTGKVQAAKIHHRRRHDIVVVLSRLRNEGGRVDAIDSMCLY